MIDFQNLGRIAHVTTNGLEVGKPAYWCGTMTPNHKGIVTRIGGRGATIRGVEYATVEVDWGDSLNRQWWQAIDLSPVPFG